MLKYIFKRILIFIPTFFLISLLIFGLSKMAPGDPVELALKGGTQAGEAGLAANLVSAERAYSEKARELGLDKPTFYFNFTSAAYPDSLYKIKKAHHRETISRLIDQYGNAKEVLIYYNDLRSFELESAGVSDSVNHLVKQAVRDIVNTLYFEYQDSSVLYQFANLKSELAKDAEYQAFIPSCDKLIADYNSIKANSSTNKLYIPSLNVYGFDNQYHDWITNFMIGNFGTSYRDNRPVSSHLWDSLWWTLVMNFFSILIAYLISIPLGVRGAVWKKDSDSYFPLVSWAAAIGAGVIILSILLGKWAVLPTAAVTWTAVITTILYCFYAIFYRQGSDDKSNIGAKIAKFFIGFVVLSAASVANYFLYIGLDYITGHLLKISLTIGIVAAELLFIYRFWGGDIRKILANKIELAKIIGLLIVLGVINYYLYTQIEMGTFLKILLMTSIVTAEIMLAVRFLGGDITTKIMTDSGDFILAGSVLWSLVALPWIIKGVISFFIGFPLFGLAVGVIACVFFFLKWRKRRGQVLTEKPTLSFKLTSWGIRSKGTIIDGVATLVLFILYSLPSFWIGTIFIVFLTTPEYGMDWFPTGVGMVKDADKLPWFGRFMNTSYELILPIFCVTYGSFAYLSRQMRGSVLAVVRQDYIRTAKAKGLSEEKVIWKHAFRNSLFPIITLFSSVFPRALGGAITIELIYNIPGMGKLVFESIVARDWPIVFTVVMFSAILTMIGNLVADMLYAAADPRVSYS